jgi:hypothetical protein
LGLPLAVHFKEALHKFSLIDQHSLRG